MDKTDEIRDDDRLEYVAPTIVDYGDIVQITAANATGTSTDVPLHGPADHLS